MFNPILSKEIKINSRSIKYSMIIILYNLALAVIAIVLMLELNSSYYSSGNVDITTLTSIFPVACWLQFAFLLLLVPSLSAPGISGERERQTLDIMLTSEMSTKAIIFGKLVSQMGLILVFVVSGIPILAVAFIYGGMSWWSLLGMVGAAFCECMLFGCIGMWCSVKFRRTVIAILVTYVIEIMLIGIPIALWYFLQYGGIRFLPDGNLTVLPHDLFLLLDPAVGFYQFVQVATGNAGIETKLLKISEQNMLLRYGFLAIHYVLELLLAYIAFCRAAYLLNPLKKIKRYRKQKQLPNE